MRNYSIVWLSIRKRVDSAFTPASVFDGIVTGDSFRIPKDAKMDGL